MLDVEKILALGKKLFDRSQILAFWQELADNFYPERADFTRSGNLSGEFGRDLMSSYPVLIRRDLGDQIGSILRPTATPWFQIRTKNDWDSIGTDGKAWLERATNIQRRAMYATGTQFNRATKAADHDFVTFGQPVLQVSPNKSANSLLFRCWHLRDVAWMEDENGVIDTVFRKREPDIRALVRMFPNSVHPSVAERASREPFATTPVWHVVMPNVADERFPFVSYYLDVTNNHMMECVPAHDLGYVIPRWRELSGTQYAISPATCVALADARLLQSMVQVLLEAGEKAVNPPIVASHEVFGGNFSMFAGGVTYADEMEGRIQDSFETLKLDRNGIPLGMDMADRVRQQLLDAFYINKLTLPPPDAGMTAYEVGQRVQENIRQIMPLMEPMESEYNAPLCDMVFSQLMRRGVFGSPLDMPEELRGKEIDFVFESPLHDMADKVKGQQFLQTKDLLVSAMEIDPTAAYIVDVSKAFRDAQQSSGAPIEWLRSESEATAMQEADAARREEAAMVAQAQAEADVSKTVADTTGPV